MNKKSILELDGVDTAHKSLHQNDNTTTAPETLRKDETSRGPPVENEPSKDGDGDTSKKPKILFTEIDTENEFEGKLRTKMVHFK